MRVWFALVALLCLVFALPSVCQEGDLFRQLGEGYGSTTTFQVALGDLDLFVPIYGMSGGPNVV